MKIVRTLSFALACMLVASFVPPAHAQTERRSSLVVGAGAINFDLSGTGMTPGFTVRASRELGGNVVFEGGLTVARPEQQFGDSTLLLPEAQLQYHWTAGRFAPYLGAGVGAARVSSDFANTDWDPTVVFAGGTRVRLDDRVGLFGEFRLRGVEWKFVGTTTDIMAGVVWRIGG